MPDATNASLTLSNVRLADSGGYLVLVSNAGGTTNSAVASLRVVSPATNTIYLDHFNGSSSALNNRTPDNGTIASNKWIAASRWRTDGTRATITNSTVNAFLPFTPVSGRLYRLSADIECLGCAVAGADEFSGIDQRHLPGGAADYGLALPAPGEVN